MIAHMYEFSDGIRAKYGLTHKSYEGAVRIPTSARILYEACRSKLSRTAGEYS